MTNEALVNSKGSAGSDSGLPPRYRPSCRTARLPVRAGDGTVLASPIVGRTVVRVGEQLEDAQWVTI
jgi:hypothetical protein